MFVRLQSSRHSCLLFSLKTISEFTLEISAFGECSLQLTIAPVS